MESQPDRRHRPGPLDALGGSAVGYLYPQGLDTLAKYFYGTFILDEPSMELGLEDIIRLPFGLIAARPDCGEFGI